MFTLILPVSVSVVTSVGDVPPTSLFPEEAASVALACEKRRREFATTRCCARLALSRLGISPVPIVRRENRSGRPELSAASPTAMDTVRRPLHETPL